MDSGREGFLGVCCDPDTLLPSSREVGFFRSSGVDLPNCPDAILGDLAGGAGFSTRDFLAGFFITGSSSDVPLALEGSVLGRTCSGLTSGASATFEATFCGTVFSGSATALATGALLFGPRARPLVMCWSSGAGPVFSSCVALVGNSVPSALDVDLLVVNAGGPRASMPTKAGLKRLASLPDRAGSFFANKGAGCTGLSSNTGLMVRRLFFLASASGVSPFGFSGGGGLDPLSARARAPLLAIASGVGAGSDILSDLFKTVPVSCALTRMADFFLTRLSLNSSRRSEGFGPPVWFRAPFPRRMLPFSTSGAT
jgi:hypothetical protein